MAIRNKARVRRKMHIRKVVNGTAERPRMVIYRSVAHMYAQLVDDVSGQTLLGVSSLSPDLKAQVTGKNPTQVAELVGSLCAQKAREKSIETVVFDRNGFPYHGRVKAVAEGARKGGLKF
ncbi:MAG: 50S ribosomal protein L18 [bacterium]|nr:50S ribosomal protein L18 [bacterium]